MISRVRKRNLTISTSFAINLGVAFLCISADDCMIFT